MEKIKKLLFILVLFIIVIIENSCVKNDSDTAWEPGVNAIEDPMINKMGFDTGSYWIYKDSATGHIDSTYVVSAGNTTVTYVSPQIAYCEMHYLAYSTYDTCFYSLRTDHEDRTLLNHILGKYCYVTLTWMKPHDTVQYNSYLRYPFNDYGLEQINKPVIECRNVIQYTKFYLNGHPYNNVLERYYGGSFTGVNPQPDYVYYFADYVGLFRKVDNIKHHVWNLQRYKTHAAVHC